MPIIEGDGRQHDSLVQNRTEELTLCWVFASELESPSRYHEASTAGLLYCALSLGMTTKLDQHLIDVEGCVSRNAQFFCRSSTKLSHPAVSDIYETHIAIMVIGGSL
ncbi:MAG: hypothetical protein ABJB22_02525 [Verrucomicrobiota bacterium]